MPTQLLLSDFEKTVFKNMLDYKEGKEKKRMNKADLMKFIRDFYLKEKIEKISRNLQNNFKAHGIFLLNRLDYDIFVKDYSKEATQILINENKGENEFGLPALKATGFYVLRVNRRGFRYKLTRKAMIFVQVATDDYLIFVNRRGKIPEKPPRQRSEKKKKRRSFEDSDDEEDNENKTRKNEENENKSDGDDDQEEKEEEGSDQYQTKKDDYDNDPRNFETVREPRSDESGSDEEEDEDNQQDDEAEEIVEDDDDDEEEEDDDHHQKSKKKSSSAQNKKKKTEDSSDTFLAQTVRPDSDESSSDQGSKQSDKDESVEEDQS